MEIDFNLYREEVVVSDRPLIRLSVINVAPEQPIEKLVMIHGFGGNALQWKYQLAAFSDDSHCIAIDLRGHGRSDAPASDYSVDEFVSDILAVLAALNVNEPVVLLGHSFGGAIAITFAHRCPERVKKLVLTATTGQYKLGPARRAALAIPTPILNLVYPFLRSQFSAVPVVLKRFHRNALNKWVGWEMMRELKVPTLVIRGDRDIVYPRGDFERVAQVIPDAEDVNVGASAHMVILERRDAVERAIERFLGMGAATWREEARREELRARLMRERPWLKSYDDTVPYTIGLPHRPLHTLLTSAAHRFPHRPASIFMGRTLTYRQVERQANRLANALRGMGVDTGARVMLLMPNTPQWVIAFYGVLKAGGTVVGSSPTSNVEELIREVEDSGAQIMITLTLFHETARAIADATGIEHVIYTNVKDYLYWWQKVFFSLTRERREGHRILGGLREGERTWVDVMRAYHANPLDVNVAPERVALIQYTGGTTDNPKGVVLSHCALLANAFQTRHWVPGLHEGRERVLCAVPFAHVYGMTAGMNVAICLGAAMIILPNFVTGDVLNAIRRHKPTLFPGVPTMYVAINNYPGVRRFGIHSIRACISGAAPLPVEVQETFEKLTKGRLVEGYGLTEAGPVTHANPLYGHRKIGTIGVPLPNTEAKIVDLMTGKDLPPGQIGELVVRGPQIMEGYWGLGQETDRAIRDGWLYTGDIARMDDDGYFQIISRKKDMILAGEYHVYPRDVEEVLYEHPGVKEVAVVGLQRRPWPSKRVKAYVVPREGSHLSKEELMALCRRRLEEYAVPWDIEFRDELPKSFVGKVLRRLLVDEEETE
jgi:long-chain acyl-CoA synthetase